MHYTNKFTKALEGKYFFANCVVNRFMSTGKKVYGVISRTENLYPFPKMYYTNKFTKVLEGKYVLFIKLSPVCFVFFLVNDVKPECIEDYVALV